MKRSEKVLPIRQGVSQNSRGKDIHGKEEGPEKIGGPLRLVIKQGGGYSF